MRDESVWYICILLLMIKNHTLKVFRPVCTTVQHVNFQRWCGCTRTSGRTSQRYSRKIWLARPWPNMLLLVSIQNVVGSCATGSPPKDAMDEEDQEQDGELPKDPHKEFAEESGPPGLNMLLLVYIQNLVGSCATGSPPKEPIDVEELESDAELPEEPSQELSEESELAGLDRTCCYWFQFRMLLEAVLQVLHQRVLKWIVLTSWRLLLDMLRLEIYAWLIACVWACLDIVFVLFAARMVNWVQRFWCLLYLEHISINDLVKPHDMFANGISVPHAVHHFVWMLFLGQISSSCCSGTCWKIGCS